MFFKFILKNKTFLEKRSSREMRIAFRGDLDCRVAPLLAMTQWKIASLRLQ